MHAPPGRDRIGWSLVAGTWSLKPFLTPTLSAANRHFDHTTRSFWLDLARHNASTTCMPTRTDEQLPWDEGAALEELERLQRGIHEWRSRRKDVQTEFDRFVRGFRTPAPTPEPDRATSERPAVTIDASRLAEYPSENAPPAPLPVALP